MEPDSTIVGNLDLSKRGDRRLLNMAVQRQTEGSVARTHRVEWDGFDAEYQKQLVQASKVALKRALETGGPREICGVITTAQTFAAQIQANEKMDQADEHRDDDNARLDEGRLTGRVGLIDEREAMRRLKANPEAHAKAIEAAEMLARADE